MTRRHLRSSSRATQGEILFGEHHESHAASAFFPSPFEAGGRPHHRRRRRVGDARRSAPAAGQRSDDLREQRFPHSLGLLYSAFTYFTGFKVNSGEYKVMGLAPYGEPKYVEGHQGPPRRDPRRRQPVGWTWSTSTIAQGLTMTGRRFERVFGGPARAAREPR